MFPLRNHNSAVLLCRPLPPAIERHVCIISSRFVDRFQSFLFHFLARATFVTFVVVAGPPWLWPGRGGGCSGYASGDLRTAPPLCWHPRDLGRRPRQCPPELAPSGHKLSETQDAGFSDTRRTPSAQNRNKKILAQVFVFEVLCCMECGT